MTVKAWLAEAHREAERKALPELKSIFDGLAQAMTTLRVADWNEDASGQSRRIDSSPDAR
jgi:hypothetical protein